MRNNLTLPLQTSNITQLLINLDEVYVGGIFINVGYCCPLSKYELTIYKIKHDVVSGIHYIRLICPNCFKTFTYVHGSILPLIRTFNDEGNLTRFYSKIAKV